MDEAIKHRLVGAGVLALLIAGGVAWLLADSSPSTPASSKPAASYVAPQTAGATFNSQIVPIPHSPADDERDSKADDWTEEPERLAVPVPSAEVGTSAQAMVTTTPPSRSVPSTNAIERVAGTGDDSRNDGEQWVVQLASFTNDANAGALHRRLRAAGYATYVERAKAHLRVIVGPMTSRAQADAARAALHELTRLTGVVRRASRP